MCVIFKDRCWVVPIPFGGMVKFKFLAHFPVDHIAYPIVSSLLLRLCQFAAFAYDVIDGFISVTTESTFAILLRLIYPPLDMIGSYGAVLCCHKERFYFSLKVSFLSHVQDLSCEMLFISRLKRLWSCFFLPFLFPSFCHFVIYRVVSIVSDVRNQSSIVFFYVVFESLYGCVNAVCLDKYRSAKVVFGMQCLVHGRWFSSSLFHFSICLSSSLVHVRKGPEYLTRSTAQVFTPLIRFLWESFVSSSFLVLLRYSF